MRMPFVRRARLGSPTSLGSGFQIRGVGVVRRRTEPAVGGVVMLLLRRRRGEMARGGRWKAPLWRFSLRAARNAQRVTKAVSNGTWTRRQQVRPIILSTTCNNVLRLNDTVSNKLTGYHVATPERLRRRTERGPRPPTGRKKKQSLLSVLVRRHENLKPPDTQVWCVQ